MATVGPRAHGLALGHSPVDIPPRKRLNDWVVSHYDTLMQREFLLMWQHEADDVAVSVGAGPGTLASDADRDSVAGLLSQAFAEGRLTAGEHGERARAAYAARTWTELARLTADLPGPADDAAGHPATAPEGMDRCLLCALLVLCPPAGIVWLLAAWHRSRPGRDQPLSLGQAAAWRGQPSRRPVGNTLQPATGAAAAVPDPVPARAGSQCCSVWPA